MDLNQLYRISDYEWSLPRSGDMKADALIVGSEALITDMDARLIQQLTAISQLPGILDKLILLPDAYPEGIFPHGLVAAFDPAEGVVLPQAVGHDINCGMRTVTTNLIYQDIEKKGETLTRELFKAIPSGEESRGKQSYAIKEISDIMEQGARWVIENRGMGKEDDLENIEDGGEIIGASPDSIPQDIIKKFKSQLGTIGSGNHFVEIQIVDEVFDIERARVFGLFKNQVVVTFHTGSRGLGQEILAHYQPLFREEMKRLKLHSPHRELTPLPVDNPLSQDFLAAMWATSNYAFANRQIISHAVHHVFNEVIKDVDTNVMYDLGHNMIKEEFHQIGTSKRKVLIHRRGATRNFPGRRPEISKTYRVTGQPVIVAGSMGQHSYVLAGSEESLIKTLGSGIQGAGRLMSEEKALKKFKTDDINLILKNFGVFLKTRNKDSILAEAPGAYKDIEEIIKSITKSHISLRVARLKPIGVIRG